jgi:hypothetical protein
MRTRVILAVLLALAAGALPTAAAQQPLYGLEYMVRFDRLPALKDAVCKQVSSYDRSGGNGDAGHFLNGDTGRLPNNRALLADLKGPGCIYRIWSANAAGFIRFYFDGEPEPRIACRMQDLFQDRYPPFRSPIAGQSSGGWYTYLPIPFAKSCRIEVDDPGPMYYQVQYHQLPEGTPVRTFTRELTSEDQAALKTVLDQWNRRGEPPSPIDGDVSTRTGQRRLEPGEKAILLDRDDPGTVRLLRIRVQPADRFSLRALALRAYWDEATVPAVEAPLGDFFGYGFGDRRFRSLPLAMRDDGYVCYFPMPFSRSARIEVVNEGKKAVDLDWEVRVSNDRPNMSEEAYFHAKWSRVTTEAGKHVPLLDTTGRGHFVGVNLNMQGDHGLWFLEGDEKIYVDGESFPSIHGTGLEDYFTGGWYFDRGPFDQSYHGALAKDDARSRINAYRYQVTDCVPFRRSLKVDIEHGGTNDYPGADYCYTTYWYQDGPQDRWSPLVPPLQRRPAVVRVANVIEAERLNMAGGRIVDDEKLPVEASGGAVAVSDADRSNARLVLTFNVPQEGYYGITLGLLKGPEYGRGWVSVDGRPVSDILDAYAAVPSIERTSAGNAGLLSPGTHILTVHLVGKNEQSTGRSIGIDYLALRKQLHPDALEGERMKILSKSPANAPLDPQDMTGFGPRWSGDSHLWFRPAGPGAAVTLELPVAAAGRYRLAVWLTKAVDYGQVQVSIDGQTVGGPVDGFNDGVIPTGRLDVGEVELAEGAHRLTFTVVGKNPRSTGYMVGVDAVVLERAP